ncbi:type VI secretion system Vgr family protein [Desulfonatronum parangueonense]
MPQLIENAFTFESMALPKETFTVVRFTGEEGLSTLYRFEILLVSEKEDLDLTAVLQNPVTFTIKGRFSGGEDLPFHGILSGFEQMHQADTYFFYRAELRPKLWWLTLTHHNQVFLDKKVDQFLGDVLKDGGLAPGLDFAFQFQGRYQPWEYVCQYGESHFHFVSRWMEREGAYYWFEQGEQSEKMIASDTLIAHAPLPGHETFLYSPPSGLDAAGAGKVIKRFTLKQSPLPRNVLLKDYNYMKPSLDLEGKAAVQDKGRGEIFLYGENFASKSEGDRLAGVRAEEYRCREKVFHGLSAIPAIRPGYLFTLNRHFREEFNQEYLTIAVRHEGSQERYLLSGLSIRDLEDRDALFYRNTFECIPSSTQFRPRRGTPKSRIAGTISAKVDAAGSGKYAELDDYGRYKVILPFDLSGRGGGKASCWLRMATPYAGEGHGMHFPLHKGTEVLLTFIDGDPDRPVIQSAVPNFETPSVVTSTGQTSSRIESGSGHKVVLQDQEGKEGVGIFASNGADDGSWMWMGKRSPESFQIKTKGDKREMVCGQDDSFVLGSENSVVIGSSADFKMGLASEYTLAEKFAFSISESLELKFGKHLEFGKSTETIKDSSDLLGVDKVEIRAGLTPAQKLKLSATRKCLSSTLAGTGAVLAAVGGDLVTIGFPEEKEGWDAAKAGLWSMLPVGVGILAQFIAMRILLAKMNDALDQAYSEIKLDNNGISLKTLPSAAQGITIEADTTSSIKVKPSPQDSIVLERANGGKIVVESGGVGLEKTGGGSIHVENGTGPDAGKVVLTKGSGKISVNDGGVEVQAGGGTEGKVALTRTSVKMEQGTSAIFINNSGIKMKFQNNEFSLSPAGIRGGATIIRLG